MKFNELDKKMRIYETTGDTSVLPDIYIVARIDGRGFTKLTKDVHQFEAPYDVRFRDLMVETVKSLMLCGFKVIYGYTQSDEISLLLDINEDSFNRKQRKLNSILAGQASAKFSLLLGDIGVFDCRLCQLPTKSLVIDYFRWRNEDANRNALNSYCYWTLRKRGISAKGASDRLLRLSVAEKNEILYQEGINFNDVPDWQKRGTGIYWEEYEKEAFNPKTKESVLAARKRLKINLNLPMKEEYNSFVHMFL
jgi:tRNA(His) 5'-end guanylyltransferase